MHKNKKFLRVLLVLMLSCVPAKSIQRFVMAGDDVQMMSGGVRMPHTVGQLTWQRQTYSPKPSRNGRSGWVEWVVAPEGELGPPLYPSDEVTVKYYSDWQLPQRYASSGFATSAMAVRNPWSIDLRGQRGDLANTAAVVLLPTGSDKLVLVSLEEWMRYANQ